VYPAFPEARSAFGQKNKTGKPARSNLPAAGASVRPIHLGRTRMLSCKSLVIGLLASSLALALPMAASAQQQNIENLKQMKLSGVDASLPPVAK